MSNVPSEIGFYRRQIAEDRRRRHNLGTTCPIGLLVSAETCMELFVFQRNLARDFRHRLMLDRMGRVLAAA